MPLTLEPVAETLAVLSTILKLVEGEIGGYLLTYSQPNLFDPRYSIIGINSFNSDPDVFTKVTPELKNWILSLVPGAQIADPTSTTGCSKA